MNYLINLFKLAFNKINGRQIHFKSIILYLLIIVLIIWVASIGFLKINANNVRSQLNNAVADTQKQAEVINSILNPNTIEPGQLDSTLKTMTSEAGVVKFRTPILPSNFSIIAIRPLDSSLRQKTHNLPDIQNLNQQTTDLISHHISVLKICTSLLTYNPAADLSAEELTQEELNFRISDAQNGLNRTLSELNAVSSYSSNDDLKALYGYIDLLKNDLELFAQSNDKNAWYDAVRRTQNKIILNRQQFWVTERNSLLTSYAIAQQAISELANSL